MDRKNQEKQYERLLEAAHGGNGEAIYELAKMYYHGRDVSRDRIKAFKYYEQAFAAGVDIDTEDLIFMANDRELSGDTLAALELYRMAAEKGDTFGYECMGEIYFRDGKYEKAWECFNKPENKSNLALYYTGYMYENGLFVEKDSKKARDCYEAVVKITVGDPVCEMDTHYRKAVEALENMGFKHESE